MNKLTKVLSVFVLAGAMAGAGTALAGCAHTHTYSDDWSKDETNHWHQGTCHDVRADEAAHDFGTDGKVCLECGYSRGTASTETSVTITEKSKTIKVGATYDVLVVVTPEGATVTWESDKPEVATVDANGKVTAVAKGTAIITAKIGDKSDTCTITVNEATEKPDPEKPGPNDPVNNDNAIVTKYEGEAEGPAAGTQNFTAGFSAENSPTAGWTDGCVTIVSGSIRNREAVEEDGSTKITGYTKSVQNGVIEIKLPVKGKITIEYSSGSGTVGAGKYKLTKPDGSAETVAVNYNAKVLRKLVIDEAEAGTYKFEKGDGTIDTYNVKVEYSMTATPIKSIEVSDGGLTDYLVTQKLNCTGVEIIAKDEAGASHNVDLKNCKFDTSKYNPNVSGEYEIGVTYYLASNLDSETKQFSATYKVKVYLVDSIKLSTIGLASSKQVTVQQAYLPDGTLTIDNLSVIATCKLGSATIEQKLKTDWYGISSPSLTAEGKKTVTVKVDTKYTVDNKSVSATYDVIVKAKKDVTDNIVEVTVGETGEFATLTQAVQYLKACAYENSVNKIIKLQKGTYTEKVWLDMDNVTLVGLGEKIDDTTLTYSLVEGDIDALSNSVWGLTCATLHVTGKNFKAYNLAIRNDFDYIANNKNYSGSQAAQGVALTLEGDGNVLYNCHLFGNQDTLYMKSGRTYYYKTQIDGNIDFIFGGEKGLAFFQECDIVAIDREAKASDNPQNGYVTAPQHKAETKPDYGYIFYKCNLTDDGNVNAGSMALGRPWGPKATVAYIECNFSAAYSTEASDGSHKIHRWCEMSGATPENADYVEYGSTGEGAITTAVKGGSVITAEKAADYTKANIFGTNNGKSGYATAFDCDAAYANLRILVGLDEGVIEEDATKTYDLRGFTGGQLDSKNPTAEYLGIKIDATIGKFNVRTGSNDDVQINTGTILKVPMAKRYKVMLTDNKDNAVLPGDDYTVEYVTEEGQLYAKITITKSGSFYARSIMVDGSVEMEETAYFDVTFDLNYTDAQVSEPVTVIGGYKVAKPADPTREGYTFNYWYVGDDDTVEYNFNTPVTAAITLKAKWTEGVTVKEAVLIEEAKEFNFGKGTATTITKAVEGKDNIDELLVNGTFKSNGGGWYSIANGTTITLKVKAGMKVVFEVYKNGSYTVTVNGEDQTSTLTSEMVTSDREAKTLAAQETDSTIVLTCTGSSCYVGIITVGELG